MKKEQSIFKSCNHNLAANTSGGESSSAKRVTASTMTARVLVGDIVHDIKVTAIPGATAGMHFEAYKQLEEVLMDSLKEDKVRKVIDPIISKAVPAVKGGISSSLIMSLINLFKGAKINQSIYHSKVKVEGDSHLADLLRQEIKGNKIHTSILMKYVKTNFMEILSDYPELTDLFMSVLDGQAANGAPPADVADSDRPLFK